MLAASALVSGVLAATPTGAGAEGSGDRAAAPEPLSLDGTVAYKCAATAAGLSLGDYQVGVRLTSEAPPLAPQGAPLPETIVHIQLTMPEGLRGATSALGATEAQGRSDNSSVAVQVGAGDPVSVPLLNVRAPRAPIPQKFGQPWIIDSAGTTAPGVGIPSDATGTLRLSAPTAFTVNATLFRPSGPGVKTTLDCTTGASVKQKLQAIIPITTPAPPSPDAILQKGPVSYGCAFTISGNPGPNIGAGVIWAYPALPTAARSGSTYPGLQQGYVLAFPDSVRQAFYGLGYRNVQAVGGSTSMGLVTGEVTTPVALNGIVSAPTEIPDTAGAPVVVRTGPTLDNWTVPDSDFTMRMGPSFQASLLFRDADNNPTSGSIACQDIGSDPTARDLTSATTYTEQVKTSTSVTASNVKVKYGETADVIATVAPTVDAGTISITKQGKKLASGDAAEPAVLATAKVSGPQTTLTLPAKSLKPGRYVLNVVYSGSGTYKSAVGRTIVRVSALDSSVEVASVTPDPIIAGTTRAIVTANVTSEAEANGESTTGIVRVLSAGREFGRGRVVDGVATVRLETFPRAGEKNLRVIYNGNSTVGTSSTTTSITVSPKN